MSAALSESASTTTDHIIDLDADPFKPYGMNGWKVEEHLNGGHFKWDASKVALYLDPRQQNGGFLEGNRLRQALAGKPVLNANVLDYLLKNPQLIPAEWKGKMIFFWGTVYRNSDARLAGRYLCWRSGRWGWSAAWLDGFFDGADIAALPAS